MDLTLIRVARRAMATTFEIALPQGTPRAVDVASAALDLIEEIEEQLTVYRETGEVARLNTTAAEGPVAVDPSLFQLLERCAAFNLETSGAFDVAVGALVEAWGFTRRAGRIPTDRELVEATGRCGFRHVILNAGHGGLTPPAQGENLLSGGRQPPVSGTVQFRRPGLKLNFGAIGKGYALDRAAGLLRRDWGIESALLQGGGSSMLGVGVPPNDPRGWPVSIRHPEPSRPSLDVVHLKDQGLGTSAATFQFFEFGGKKYGHVLDPRTGRPAAGTRSASCIADNAAEADAISTAFFVAGLDWAREYLRSRTNLAAVILNEGEERAVRLGTTSASGTA